MSFANISDFLPNNPNRSFEEYEGVCDTHGNFTSWRGINSDFSQCPKCDLEKNTQEIIETARKKRVLHLLSIADIPPKYTNAGLRNFITPTEDHKKAKSAVSAYIKGLSKSKLSWTPLLVSGSFGTGKTHIACALANNFIEKGISVKYATVASMLADIRSAYGRVEGKTEAGQIAHYVKGFDVLILDEADLHIRSENDMGLVFAVINGRYNQMKPVIIVTNQSPKNGLGDLIGGRSLDRIMENVTQVVCDWKSHRRAD